MKEYSLCQCRISARIVSDSHAQHPFLRTVFEKGAANSRLKFRCSASLYTATYWVWRAQDTPKTDVQQAQTSTSSEKRPCPKTKISLSEVWKKHQEIKQNLMLSMFIKYFKLKHTSSIFSILGGQAVSDHFWLIGSQIWPSSSRIRISIPRGANRLLWSPSGFSLPF